MVFMGQLYWISVIFFFWWLYSIYKRFINFSKLFLISSTSTEVIILVFVFYLLMGNKTRRTFSFEHLFYHFSMVKNLVQCIFVKCLYQMYFLLNATLYTLPFFLHLFSLKIIIIIIIIINIYIYILGPTSFFTFFFFHLFHLLEAYQNVSFLSFCFFVVLVDYVEWNMLVGLYRFNFFCQNITFYQGPNAI